MDAALQSTTGSRALWQSLALLGLTALFQLGIALLSHSFSLLADTLHNGANALTALPLLLAFALARRPPPGASRMAMGAPWTWPGWSSCSSSRRWPP